MDNGSEERRFEERRLEEERSVEGTRWKEWQFTEDAVDEAEAAAGTRDLVSHVRVVAVLTAIQGALQSAIGVFFLGLAIAMPFLADYATSVDSQLDSAKAAETEFGVKLAGVIYIFMGIPLLISGLFMVIAAWRMLRYRGRVFSIVSLIVGSIGAVCGCYCAPTGIGLAIYGLIVLFNPFVATKFEAEALDALDALAPDKGSRQE